MEEYGPRQRAAETKRRRTREALVAAAIEAGSIRKVEDIAEGAGVSLATLYNHFDTKKALLDAAYERLMSPVTEPIIEANASGAYNPPNRLAEVVRFLRDAARLAGDHRALTTELVRAWLDEQASYADKEDAPQPTIAPRLETAMEVIVRDHFPRHVRCYAFIKALLVDTCEGFHDPTGVAANVAGLAVRVLQSPHDPATDGLILDMLA